MPDVHAVIDKLPHPKAGWVMPSFSGSYCGPSNPLHEQLDENGDPKPGHEPLHELDSVCMWHDKQYDRFPEEKHRWDKEMLKKIDDLGPSSGWKESIARKVVRGVIWGKVKLGLGIVDSDEEEEEKKVIILHAPNVEMGKLLKEMGFPKR